MTARWLDDFTEAFEYLSGGRYWADSVWDGWAPTSAAQPPWGELEGQVADDLRAWWSWVDSRPLPQWSCPLIPSSETALGLEQASQFARRLAALDTPANDFWNPAWVPLTGDQDAAIIVDTSDPTAPVYRWELENPTRRLLGHGVDYLPRVLTSLMSSGCFRVLEFPGFTVFPLTDAPLPRSIDPTHPIVDSAARWARSHPEAAS